MARVTAPTAVKTIRVDLDLWNWVEKRARVKDISPNAYVSVCIESARKRVEKTGSDG
jgi:hypothetical protein